MTKRKIVGVIPARYQSSRFPGKPLAEIDGRTLIHLTYSNAKETNLFDQLIVATDDDRIFAHVENFGGEAVMTSPHHLTGTDRIAEALDIIACPEDAIVVNIQGDVPLIESHVVSSAIQLLLQNPREVMATAAVPIKSSEELHDPHVVKCVLDKTGRALYFSRESIPYSRNGQTPRYHHLGIYVYTRAFVRQYISLPPTPLQLAEDLEQLKALEHGFPIKVALVESQCFGIDRPEDLKRLEVCL